MIDPFPLEEQSKEQIIIFLHNAELEFGNIDGMNGSCVDCSYENKELFNKCWNFRWNEKGE